MDSLNDLMLPRRRFFSLFPEETRGGAAEEQRASAKCWVARRRSLLRARTMWKFRMTKRKKGRMWSTWNRNDIIRREEGEKDLPNYE
jgi:hypothetical protein